MFADQKYTDVEIAFVASLKEDTDLGWADITEKFNKKFNQNRSSEGLRKGYTTSRDRIAGGNGEYVRLYRSVAQTKKANSVNSKDLRNVINEWDKREDILEAIKGAAREVNKINIPVAKVSKGKKSNMTMELLVSDVHVGKLTDTFNHEVLKRRLGQIAQTTIKEMDRASCVYNVDRIIIALLGDILENSTMHGVESSKGCEFGNSRQVQESLTQLFTLVIKPIVLHAAKLGAKVDIVGITGNHDRTDIHRTFNRVGEENLTYIVYKTMEQFSLLSGLKNVSWQIPIEPYIREEIYGEGVLYEHYDNAKSNSRQALEFLMAKRVNQLKKPVRFMRGGHFHEPTEFGVGKIIINGNVPGNDGYSISHGFDCEPSQTLNFYIEREKSDLIKRETSFFKRMIIQLN